MSNFCLIPSVAEKFKKDIISGEIDPAKLALMTSAERHAFFAEKLGSASAKEVNALFESKLILKNQQQGYISWAKRVIGISKVARRDLISRIERLDKVLSPAEEEAFLNDLVDKRLGIDVTFGEAQTIAKFSKQIEKAKGNIPENSPIRSPERLEYGTSVALLKDYFLELKQDATKLTARELLKNPKEILNMATGFTKSTVASLDNSFFGRQGIKVLYTHPTVWMKNFGKSWSDIGKQIVAKGKWYKSGDDAVNIALKADIYSRPNALNNKYNVGDFGLDVNSEEAFPSALPEKIPLLGRLFKASEVAYNGAAMRMRADLADMIIEKAESQGINMLKKEEARPIGDLVAAMTGRGKLKTFESASSGLNTYLFSPKFLRSNFDTLTAHVFNSKSSPFVKKEAAKNLLKIIGSIATILTVSEILHPGSVEKDPRSSNFAKLKLGKRYYDISGGMASLVHLASQIVPTEHDGQWGFWSKSTTTGQYNKLNAKDKNGKPKYGAATALDVIDNFWQGKLSPLGGLLRDVWKGQTYSGKPVTVKNELSQVTTPLSAQNFEQTMGDPDKVDVLMMMILDGLGYSVTTPPPTKPAKEKKTSKPKF